MIRTTRWLGDPPPVEALETLTQHRPVVLLADASGDVNNSSRVDAEEIAIVGEVMDCAEGEAVDHGRHSFGQRVGDDMSCLD